MGAVYDRLNITAADARTYLRAEALPDENRVIEMLISSAKRAADSFLGNDFDEIYGEVLGYSDGSTVAYPLRYSPAYNVTVYADGNEIHKSAVITAPQVGLAAPPLAGTKITADYKTPDLPIPENIRLWVLQVVTREYERRTNGLQQQSDQIGLATWKPRDYTDIWEYRKNPGW